ncbi:MAG: hypothetical protein NXI27_12415 [Alphaproteobacteria bacterium]|nr:hypothetical protein [Alphaproteobacteria bacterium]
MTLRTRSARQFDLGAIMQIYRKSLHNAVATDETTPPTVDEMTKRFTALTDGGYPNTV